MKIRPYMVKYLGNSLFNSMSLIEVQDGQLNRQPLYFYFAEHSY